MSPLRKAFLLSVLMVAVSVGAVVARPSAKVGETGPPLVLERVVPKQFGEWREERQQGGQIVNPETQALLDRLYSQLLTRSYVNAEGQRVMLSLAYGNDQRGGLQAHRPEVCYPAQGFKLLSNEKGELATHFGTIPVHRLLTVLGPRQEPVTYWFSFGDRVVEGALNKRLIEMRYGLTGRIPDGLLFRVSSIDPDPARAFRLHENFIAQLLDALPAADRARLGGLPG